MDSVVFFGDFYNGGNDKQVRLIHLPQKDESG